MLSQHSGMKVEKSANRYLSAKEPMYMHTYALCSRHSLIQMVFFQLIPLSCVVFFIIFPIVGMENIFGDQFEAGFPKVDSHYAGTTATTLTLVGL